MKTTWITALVLGVMTTASSFAAQSYIIVDNQTGHILAAEDRDAKLPVASLTKVATAMVVLDWAQLNKADLSQIVPAARRCHTGWRGESRRTPGRRHGQPARPDLLLAHGVGQHRRDDARIRGRHTAPECRRPRPCWQFCGPHERAGPPARHETHAFPQSLRLGQRPRKCPLLNRYRHGSPDPLRL